MHGGQSREYRLQAEPAAARYAATGSDRPLVRVRPDLARAYARRGHTRAVHVHVHDHVP